MAWRSVVIGNPAKLRYKHKALVVEQEIGAASVPLEDIAVLVIDNPQVTLTSQLLSACADRHLAVITVGSTHVPNGIFLPFLPHSRALRVMRRQLAMTQPHKKRLWQCIVRQKLLNQEGVLKLHNHHKAARDVGLLASRVRSGDPDNHEAQGAQIYFNALFGKGFSRDLSVIANAALNYGYSIVRSALARSLVGYGFLPAFGLHHDSEQNAFNLADDLLEPYRPHVDVLVCDLCPQVHDIDELTPKIKVDLVGILQKDIPLLERGAMTGRSTMLALINATASSLGQCVDGGGTDLVLPGMLERVS